MKWSFLLFSSLLCLRAFAQYPATGNKARLGWQTTGDGLVYRGAIGDTTTLDPSGLNNAWMLLDTASGNLYAYRAKAWRLVSGGGGGGGLTMPFDSVTFNVNETDASLRELKYSEEKGYLQYGGQDSVQIPILPGIWYVRNDTSVTIPKGTVLRATGTLGASGRIKVKHMIANGSIDAMYILGIAMHDIAVGADGYAMSQGKIRQVNTQAYSEGAVLYADVDTLGGLTQTEPGNGFLKLPIAFVVHSASNGVLAVRVTSGAYMRDLHDVEVTSPATNASLYYNTAQGIWRDTGAAVLVADTAAMLTPYLKKADTTSLSNRINTKLNISDTTAMLSPYLKKADTTSLSNRINLKLNISDTSVFARDFQISGTTNYLAKFTGSNAVGNSQVFDDGTNVGIGDATPSYKLDVNGTAYATTVITNGNFVGNGQLTTADPRSGLVSIGPSSNTVPQYFMGGYGTFYGAGHTTKPGDIEFGVGQNTAGKIVFYTDNFAQNQTMTLTNNSFVGINTASPSRPLHVNANSSMIIPSGATGTRPASGADGDLRYSTTFNNIEFYDGSRGLWERPLVGTVANNKVAFALGDTLTSNTNLHWDNTNTRLGIGNATPDSTLTVTGGIRATRDMYARRYNVSTFTGQVLSINNYAPAGSLGRNVWIGDGGQLSQYTGGQTGGYNVSLGAEALGRNTTGFGNIAVASQALGFNTTGSANVAVGGATLAANTTYSYNTAVGANALQNSNSFSNTAVGQAALGAYNETGSNDYGYNTAIGVGALASKTTGEKDVAIGWFAGRYVPGVGDVTSSNKNVFIGAEAYPNGNGQTGQIVIGYGAVGNGSYTTTIGNSSTTATIFQYGETRLGMAVDSGAYTLQVNGNTKLIGNLARKKPVTIAAATYTVLSDDSWLICNHTAQITITLPTAANSIGRELMIKYVAGGGATVISNATNVSPIVGGALTNIILPATAGSWVTLVCDGANWIIMQKG